MSGPVAATMARTISGTHNNTETFARQTLGSKRRALNREGARDHPIKDAFDLWREWATKPHESMLSVDGDIHYHIMELLPEDRRDREKVNEAVRRYRENQKCST
jgi:hypothetical protein